MIHWTWVVFSIVIFFLLFKIHKGNKRASSFDFITPFLIFLLLAFILIWGGIFWW